MIYSRTVSDDDVAFVGGGATDPAFEAMLDAVTAPIGDPVKNYARPLTSEQVDDFHGKLDAVEPAAASAAARLHMFFAG